MILKQSCALRFSYIPPVDSKIVIRTSYIDRSFPLNNLIFIDQTTCLKFMTWSLEMIILKWHIECSYIQQQLITCWQQNSLFRIFCVYGIVAY